MNRALFALLLTPALLFAQDVAPATAEIKKPKKQNTEQTAWIAEFELKLAADEDPFSDMPFGPQRMNFLGYLSDIRKAAKDSEIDGVLIKLTSTPLGWARMMELREALLELRKSGKKVFLYKENYMTPDLILAGAADRVSMPETGMVALPGLAIEMMYMKGLLDKLHIKFDVIHIGDFKTAGESMVRDTMSDAQRKSLAPILDEFYSSMIKSIADGRGLNEEQVKAAIDKGIFYGKAAKEAGLVDRIEYRDQFVEGMKATFPGKTVKKSTKYGPGKGTKIDPNNPMAAFTVMMQMLMGGAPKKKLEGPRVHRRHHVGQEPVRLVGRHRLDGLRHDRQGDRQGAQGRRHQGDRAAGEQPGRLGARQRHDLACRGPRETEEAGHRFDGRCGRFRRVLHLDELRRDLRGAADDHRIDRRGRNGAEHG
jgi:protease-4